MESISAFDIIKIGIGPSSSHTMGPWKAALQFIHRLKNENRLKEVKALRVELYGALAKTGIGHGTDLAVIMGLQGFDYQTVDTSSLMELFAKQKQSSFLPLDGTHTIPFPYSQSILFKPEITPDFHSNGLRFEAQLESGSILAETFYSIGGGFIVSESETGNTVPGKIRTPYPCHTGKDLIETCKKLNLRVSDLTILNEQTWRNRAGIDNQARILWREMVECVYRGCHTTGSLPGGLGVKRRAADINRRIMETHHYKNPKEWLEIIRMQPRDFTTINKWVSCFALAVNEENASFGRIVTAPTNGAAGVIPAVLLYAWCFIDGVDVEKVLRFILTAGEIGTIFKKNATISAAMGGCQAEIGVSSAMAAAGLTEILGGSPEQVVQAAEIAMEHHLGLTCDPIAGLVQIPCIERNTMGAIKAITASTIALESNPEEAKISLDTVIKTMWETARDMNSKYKETADGGLAAQISVNLPEC